MMGRVREALLAYKESMLDVVEAWDPPGTMRPTTTPGIEEELNRYKVILAIVDFGVSKLLTGLREMK